MKRKIFSKLLSGTLLAATVMMLTPISVFAESIDGTKLAVNEKKDDTILLRGDISLTDKDEKVTLSLKDSDVEQVLRMFADIAGMNRANPLATILSAAMMLRYSFDLMEEADCIENAVNSALNDGCRTADILGRSNAEPLSCTEMTQAVLDRL